MSLLALSGNILWVLGLALLLSSLGWWLWHARTRRTGADERSPDLWLPPAAILVCVGVSLAASQPWARILFASLATGLAVLSALQRLHIEESEP